MKIKRVEETAEDKKRRMALNGEMSRPQQRRVRRQLQHVEILLEVGLSRFAGDMSYCPTRTHIEGSGRELRYIAVIGSRYEIIRVTS